MGGSSGETVITLVLCRNVDLNLKAFANALPFLFKQHFSNFEVILQQKQELLFIS